MIFFTQNPAMIFLCLTLNLTKLSFTDKTAAPAANLLSSNVTIVSGPKCFLSSCSFVVFPCCLKWSLVSVFLCTALCS